mgnify:FL=1|jgi:uncharacterized protein YecT (DUF1311 family)
MDYHVRIMGNKMKKTLYIFLFVMCGAKAGECVSTQCIMIQSIENQKNEDKKLNENYGKLKLHLKSDDFSTLRVIQKKWIKLRDSVCSDEVYNKEDFGNEAPIEKQLCLYSQTKARNVELASLYDNSVRESVNFSIQSVLSKISTGADYTRKKEELKNIKTGSTLFYDYVTSSCSLSKKVNNEDESECVFRLNVLK